MNKFKTIAMALALSLTLASCANENNTTETKDAETKVEETDQNKTSQDSDKEELSTNDSEDEAADYSEISGTYEGVSEGYAGEVKAIVDLEDGTIKDIKTEETETSVVGSVAIDKLRDRVIGANSTDIDRVSGATVSSAAFLSAVNSALESADIDPSKLAKNEVADEIEDSYESQVVIVGAGGAGLTSAIELAQNGVDVIVLEKAGITGGNTSYASAGMNAAETKLQAENEVPDTAKLFAKDTMEGGKNLNNPDLVAKLTEESNDAVEWLEENGVVYTQLKYSGGQSEMRTHAPTNEEGKTIPVGIYMIEKLTKKAEEEGVKIIYEAKVDDLIMEDGKAKGVKASTTDKEITVNAEAVIVASGGFGGNMDRVKEYREDLDGYVSTNASSIDGDAVDFLKESNAKFIDMDQIQIHPTVYQKNGSLISEGLRGEGAILINNEGKRFYNELETRDNVSAAILSQEGSNAWLIVDQAMLDESATVKTYLDKGFLTEAKDYKELADLIGCDEEAIKETLEGWNKIVADNNDPDFNREGMDTVKSDLSKAPYYAVQIAPGIHHTMGGVEINTNSEVIDKDGNIIPGLYAAGEVAGGVHGANRLGGNAITDIVVFGRNAAKNAKGYIEE